MREIRLVHFLLAPGLQTRTIATRSRPGNKTSSFSYCVRF